jgi:DNA-binding MarR family transcriptional regulator
MSSNAFEKIDPMAAVALHTARGEVQLRIEAALRSDPQRTDSQLARELELKRTAIAHIRAALEAQGQIAVVRQSRFRIVS